MCSTAWLDFNFYAETVGFTLSLLLNLTLLLLIIKMPKKIFGSYKYLMFSFSTGGIVFSCCDFIMKPNTHITQRSFVIFSVLGESVLSKPITEVALSVLCASYGMLLALLTIHFYYRYLSVCSPNKLTKFSPNNCIWWALLVTANFALWLFCCYIWNAPAPMKDEIIIPEFRKAYCLEPDEYTYSGAQYIYIDHSSGNLQFNLPSFLSEGITGTIMVICLALLTYFGYETYCHLQKLIQMTSFVNMDLQKQLFQALVLQTIIPAFFMYLPVSCLVLFPLFGIRMGEVANLVIISVSIYPCFEPMVAMYCIKRFRRQIGNFLFCRKPIQSHVQVQPMTCPF